MEFRRVLFRSYKGIIGLCEALVGARTHATIASMSQGLPTVSVAYSRKAWGIMRDYYGEKLGQALTVDVADLDRERLREAFDKALGNGRTPHLAAEMKRRAMLNFKRVKDYLAEASARWGKRLRILRGSSALSSAKFVFMRSEKGK